MMRFNQLAFSLLAGASTLAMIPAANAQDASTDNSAAAPAAETGVPANSADATQAIVVTGSRVIQNGNNMPTPVTVVSTEQLLQTTPSNVQDGLQALPVLSGSGPAVQPGNSSQNSAAHTLNLRNVGTTRTLVLFDGRRIAPTSPDGQVNADLAPSMLLQRVDIVTGGASAVYGSDAVTGVVNFVVDQNFNGLKVNAQAGISQLGDAASQRLGIAGGTRLFGGRGHIEGSYEYYNSPGVDTKLTRKWGARVYTVQGKGDDNLPYRLIQDTRLSSTSYYGLIKAGANATDPTNPLADMVFRQNGVLSPFQHGTPIVGADGTTIAGVESGGDGAFYDKSSLYSLFKSHHVFGRFDFDVTDSVHFYVEGVGMWSHNRNNHQNNELPRNTTMSVDNAFLPAEYRDIMTAAGLSTFNYTKMFEDFPVLQPDTHTRETLVTTGFSGDLGRFKWDVSYLFQDNVQKTANNANLDNQKLAAALDAVTDPSTGDVVCNVTLTNPGLYPGCVPLNVFGPTSESQDAINYVVTKTQFRAHTRMHDVGGSISGSPFSTWAGEANFALSGEWRRLEYDLVSDAQPIAADCTGLRYNCSASTLKYISNVRGNRTPVSQTVKEVAIEGDVPLLKDVPFFQSLSVNGAFRYTDYNTSGSVETWKAGVDWHINDSITLRGTRSRDIRAPNLNDLFAPQLINPAGTSDLHTGVVGQAPFISESNPDLKPEVAYTWTAGIVLQPTFIPHFSMSVDWYKIVINNAITGIAGWDSAIQQICENSNGTSSYCDLIHRPGPFSDRSPANTADAYYSRPQNAQVLKTDGIDFEMNYRTDLAGGSLSLRNLVSYQPHLTTVQFPGAPQQEAADTGGQAKWRGTSFLDYTFGDFSVDIQERWHVSTDWNSNHSLVYLNGRLPAAAWTNLTFTANIKPFQYFISVSNLFNKQPTPFGNIGGSSGVPGLFGGYVSGDDTLGRYFTMGVRLRL